MKKRALRLLNRLFQELKNILGANINQVEKDQNVLIVPGSHLLFMANLESA